MVAPTPVVALNRCVAVAEVHGPGAALGLLDQLDLDGYHLFHAARADLLRRLGRTADAAAYDAALARTANGAERAFLTRQRDTLGVPSPPPPSAPSALSSREPPDDSPEVLRSGR